VVGSPAADSPAAAEAGSLAAVGDSQGNLAVVAAGSQDILAVGTGHKDFPVEDSRRAAAVVVLQTVAGSSPVEAPADSPAEDSPEAGSPAGVAVLRRLAEDSLGADMRPVTRAHVQARRIRAQAQVLVQEQAQVLAQEQMHSRGQAQVQTTTMGCPTFSSTLFVLGPRAPDSRQRDLVQVVPDRD